MPQRLGYTNNRTIKWLSKNEVLSGVNLNDTLDRIPCQPCVKGKHTRSPYIGKPTSKVGSLGDIIFSDVCGPMNEPTWGDAKFFVTFIDGNSAHVMVTLLRKKSKVFNAFKYYVKKLKNAFNIKIRRLHTDDGEEYSRRDITLFCKENGIGHSFSAAYSPQSNGSAERMNKTFLNKLRSMLFDEGLSNKFWGEALHHAVYLQNLIPANERKVLPMEFISKHKPDVSRLKY